MARLSKEDWLAEGFKVLSEFAQHKLRILYLCERLGVTRGSFYHHFESIEDYIEQLMQSWEQQNTLQLIELANTAEGPKERFQKLNEMVVSLDQSIETAIRS
ncbi:MAG: TetR/AcrR family transcriptional regulator, partial [Bacteroidota bacterium]